MKHERFVRFTTLVFAAVLVVDASPPGALSASTPPSAAAAVQTVLVRVDSAATTNSTDDWIVVTVSPDDDPQVLASQYAAFTGVEAMVERVYVSSGFPDDPLYPQQWHLGAVGVPDVWGTTRGSGVKVAILDTGLTPGSDLACASIVSPYNAITETEGMAAIADDTGHGTFVAGVVAQCTNNSLGVAGVADGVDLMPVRVLEDGVGGSLDVGRGIEWAVDNGADVVNLSLGLACEGDVWPTCGDIVIDDAISYAESNGVVVVAATGNDSDSSVSYPAAHPLVVAVGAVDQGLALASFSNWGEAMGLVAPGVDILQEGLSNGSHAYLVGAGTSFAAPHVAGGVALILAIEPGLAPSGVRDLLYQSATDLGAGGWDSTFGHGLVQVAAAIEALDLPPLANGPVDFNGDGVEDVAAGVPGESIGSVAASGLVNVLYGSESGVAATGDQTWHRNSGGIGGDPVTGEALGWTQAAGDYNGDGKSDLAIGVPGANGSSGEVIVLYGSGSGLTAAGSQTWSEDDVPAGGGAGSTNGFGSALVSGDFDGDGYDDLAVGSPGTAVGGEAAAGAVYVLSGSGPGLTADDAQIWTQDTSGVKGVAEAGDGFGSVLTSGDLDGDGRSDLVVGVPAEDLAGTADTGSLHILPGSPSGLTAVGDQVWHQDSSGIKGVAEAGDRFASSLATGDINGDSRLDLIVGVAYESVGSADGAGLVHVLYGSGGGGVTAKGDQIWHQSTTGIQGAPETDDHFGAAVTTGDVDGDGFDDIIVGVPDEDLGELVDAGMVHVIYGASSGATATGAQVWHQGSSGIGGARESGDRFGAALAARDVTNDGRDDLIIGVPYEDLGSTVDAGMLHVIPGSSSGATSVGSQTWHQDSVGIGAVGEAGDLFGFSLS